MNCVRIVTHWNTQNESGVTKHTERAVERFSKKKKQKKTWKTIPKRKCCVCTVER